MGLKAPLVPSAIADLKPASITCLATYDIAAGERIRGIFTEFAAPDDENHIVAVVAVINEAEQRTEWELYLREVLADRNLEYLPSKDDTLIAVADSRIIRDALLETQESVTLELPRLKPDSVTAGPTQHEGH